MTKRFLHPFLLLTSRPLHKLCPLPGMPFPLNPVLGDPKPGASPFWAEKLGEPAPHPRAFQAPGSTPGASLGCEKFRVRLGSHFSLWGPRRPREEPPPALAAHLVCALRMSRGIFLGT